MILHPCLTVMHHNTNPGNTGHEARVALFSYFIVNVQRRQQQSCVCYWLTHLGLSSGGALLKLTTGIWSVAGRLWSVGGRKGRGGRRGERRGELSPLVRRRGERGARDTECCSSSFSSSSRMEGSFFTRPPLLSQSTLEKHKETLFFMFCMH